MNWIEIDLYDENANVPELNEDVLVHFDESFAVAKYRGFGEHYRFDKIHKISKVYKCHDFIELREEDVLLGTTHWCRLEKPE